MKKMKALALLCALALTANSQPYGQQTYNNPNPSKLSCGKRTSFSPQGFLMGGYVPSTSAGSDNFYIDRTSTGGGISGPPAFAQGYQVYWNNCTTSYNQELNCYGVDVVECSTNLTTASYYVAVATDNGCWFEGIDNSGNTISSLLQAVQFPSGAWGITSPKIIESTDTPGEYYVAGAYITSQSSSNTGVMYVFKVDGSGTILWNQTYTAGGSATRLWPAAIIESPYAAPGRPELAVFGNWYSGPANLDHEGFYVTIDAMNGTGGSVIIADHYGVPVIGHEDRFFAATIAMSGATGGPGYAIGGFSAGSPTTGSSWMLKISPSGGPVQWSNAYQSSWGSTDVVGIAERFSTVYSSYEYYGTAVGPLSGMVVMKLDANGNPFSQAGNINNDFLYTAGSNPVSVPTSISYINTGTSSSDVGIHVYGTDNTSTGNFYLVEAAFNGQSGCGTANENLAATPLLTGTGPNFNGNLPIKINNGLGTCAVFQITNSSTGVAPSSICGVASLPASANNRSMATGIAKNSLAGHLFSVYPNPSGDRVQLSGSGYSGEPVKIELMNTLGQLVAPTATGSFDNSGSYSTEFDLHALGLEAGVYFARIHANGAVSEQKILYTK